jgi:ribosomal protein L44E
MSEEQPTETTEVEPDVSTTSTDEVTELKAQLASQAELIEQLTSEKLIAVKTESRPPHKADQYVKKPKQVIHVECTRCKSSFPHAVETSDEIPLYCRACLEMMDKILGVSAEEWTPTRGLIRAFEPPEGHPVVIPPAGRFKKDRVAVHGKNMVLYNSAHPAHPWMMDLDDFFRRYEPLQMCAGCGRKYGESWLIEDLCFGCFKKA